MLFRVDGGPGIGLGHVHRCLALAEGLRRHCIQSVFLLAPTSNATGRVTHRGFPVEIMPGVACGAPEDCTAVIAGAKRHGFRTVVVDSYAAGGEYLSRLTSVGLRLVLIDDEGRHHAPAHIVVNGGAHAARDLYQSDGGQMRLMLGPQHALLRSEFWDCPQRRIAASVQRVLITLGGDDPHNLTPCLIEFLSGQVTVGGRLDVVVGPFFRNAKAVERAAASSALAVDLIPAPQRLRDLMMECDLAVSAGGQTAYELAATGTPAVVVALYKNQRAGVRALAKGGTLFYGGGLDTARLSKVLKMALRTVISSTRVRNQLSVAGRLLVDGQGALRVAAEVARVA